MTVLMLALATSFASAVDADDDGCVDSYFDANGACVSPSASLDPGVTVGASSEVRDEALVGADTALGANVVVAERSTITGRVSAPGARPIGAGTVIGRRANIGADHDIGADNTLGRAATVGARLQTADGVVIGYANDVGDDVTIGGSAFLGALVEIGDNTEIAAGTIVARNVTIADSDAVATIGGIIGPNVVIGANGDIADNTRIRKGVTIGADVVIRDGARIGRDVVIEGGAIIDSDARLGAGVTVTANTLVPADAVVRRGDTYDDPQTTSCVQPWLPTQGQGVLSDGIGTNTVWSHANSTKSYNSAVLAFDFTGDFEVVASWGTPAQGLGLVHGSTVSFQDVNGYSSSGGGTYWDSLSLTGFPNGYAATYKGLYNVGTNQYIQWRREGGTVSILTSTGPSGPWSHIGGSPFQVPAQDTVVIGAGEGSGGTNSSALLQLVSCTSN